MSELEALTCEMEQQVVRKAGYEYFRFRGRAKVRRGPIESKFALSEEASDEIARIILADFRKQSK